MRSGFDFSLRHFPMSRWSWPVERAFSLFILSRLVLMTLDLSQEMLDLAEKRSREAGLEIFFGQQWCWI